jgi:hypothetical protein
MADRIKPVHSSSRSRTHAPTGQFGRSFNLLRLKANYHEVVIPRFQAARWRLITLIAATDTRYTLRLRQL